MADPVPLLEGQDVQAADDRPDALKVSAAQPSMLLLPDPVNPASATQSASASDPAGLPLLAGQATQAAAESDNTL